MQNMYIFDVPLNDFFILDPRHDANSILDQTKTKSTKKIDLYYVSVQKHHEKLKANLTLGISTLSFRKS